MLSTAERYLLKDGTCIGSPYDWLHADPGRAALYQAMVKPAWPLVTAGLTGHGKTHSTYARHTLSARLAAAAGHLAYARVIPLELQRTILTLMGTLPDMSWDDGCQYFYCGFPSPKRAAGDAIREDWIHHAFAHELQTVLEEALTLQLPADWTLGMPRFLKRHPWRRAPKEARADS